MTTPSKGIMFYSFIFYAGLFIYAFDYKGLANILILIWIILSIVFRNNHVFYVSREAKCLAVFGIIYAIISTFYYGLEPQLIIRIAIAPTCAYVIAENYCIDTGKINNVILVIASGLFLHAFLNMFVAIASGYTAGKVQNIWGGELTQTYIGMLLTPMASLFYFSAINLKKRISALLVLFASICSLYFTFITGRRTLVYIFFIIIIVNYIRRLIQSESYSTAIKRVLGLILCMGIAAALYLVNFLGVKEFVESSSFYNRVFITGSAQLGVSRSEIQWDVILHFYDHIFGGNHPISYATYAHNLWLDVLIMCGVIPMCFLMMYSVMTIKTLFSYCRDEEIAEESKILYLSIFTALILAFSVEPVLSGVPHVFVLFCAMNGSVHSSQHIVIDNHC